MVESKAQEEIVLASLHELGTKPDP